MTGGGLGLANAPDFLADRYGEIRVSGGMLNLESPITSSGGYGVAKTGDGTLRLSSRHTYGGAMRLKAGCLMLTNGADLAGAVFVEAPDATLRLEGNAQIGSIESWCMPPTTVGLGGYTLSLGGEASVRVFDGCFTNGTLRFTRGNALVVTDTQRVSSVRLENGRLVCGNSVDITGWWRFDDTAQVGKDSGPRANHLVTYGTQAQWLANDPERGSVLALEGAGAWLRIPGGGQFTGLPVSDMSFTVALWVKPDASAAATAGICTWGLAGSAWRYNMLRLNTPSS
ncbi:MAG: hypothetical protein PHS50_06380, partial [Kiritimatiellae bacterium]|nr:hypothetical protein [Kiritimatiellia bacterium]